MILQNSVGLGASMCLGADGLCVGEFSLLCTRCLLRKCLLLGGVCLLAGSGLGGDGCFAVGHLFGDCVFQRALGSFGTGLLSVNLGVECCVSVGTGSGLGGDGLLEFLPLGRNCLFACLLLGGDGLLAVSYFLLETFFGLWGFVQNGLNLFARLGQKKICHILVFFYCCFFFAST